MILVKGLLLNQSAAVAAGKVETKRRHGTNCKWRDDQRQHLFVSDCCTCCKAITDFESNRSSHLRYFGCVCAFLCLFFSFIYLLIKF